MAIIANHRLLFWKRKPVDPAVPTPPVAKPTTTNHEMEDNAVVLWSQRWLIDFIDAFLMRWCQFSLMIGCILGTFGLYATSFNLTAQPAFNGLWAGIQAVSIDGLFFAVWSVWRRSAGKGWLRAWYFFIGVLLMIVAAMVNGVVSYTELHKVATISLTMQELHINESVFSWSRSVLVVLVAVLITTLPRGSKIEQPVPVESPQVEEQKIEVTPAIDTEKMLQSIQEMHITAMQEMMKQYSQVTVELVRETVDRSIATIALPQITAPIETVISDDNPDELKTVSGDEKPIYLTKKEAPDGGYGNAIEALMKENPDISAKEIVERLGCVPKTAYTWMKRVQVVTPMGEG